MGGAANSLHAKAWGRRPWMTRSEADSFLSLRHMLNSRTTLDPANGSGVTPTSLKRLVLSSSNGREYYSTARGDAEVVLRTPGGVAGRQREGQYRLYVSRDLWYVERWHARRTDCRYYWVSLSIAHVQIQLVTTSRSCKAPVAVVIFGGPSVKEPTAAPAPRRPTETSVCFKFAGASFLRSVRCDKERKVTGVH